MKILNYLTIVLLEHFHVAAEHRFDSEPLSLLRIAVLNVIYRSTVSCNSWPVQIENSVNMTLPMEDAH